ncbi:UNVERIFIED_CONTAM: hypothetical protein K2H54_059807 [Gekko kuhli]
MRQAIPPEKRVAITLWWLAGYNCFREVSNQFGVAKSTIVSIVAEGWNVHMASGGGPATGQVACTVCMDMDHPRAAVMPNRQTDNVTASEHEGPRSPLVMQPVDTPPGDATVNRILYLLDLQQKAFRHLNRDVAQLRQTLGLPPAVIPTDSEGPCSDPGATARGDLPLAIPAVAAAAPPVDSGATPPPGAGPSTSHGM